MQQLVKKWHLPLTAVKTIFVKIGMMNLYLRIAQNDFSSFLMEDFKTNDSDTRRNPRDLRRKPGVYVPKGWSVLISGSLY